MIYNNKTIYFISQYSWSLDIYLREHYGWLNFSADALLSSSKSWKEIEQQIKSITTNETPKEGSVLFFGKTSSYPRYKLKDYYKRCIKVEKSDYQILGSLDTSAKDNMYLFEKDECYYAIFDISSFKIDKTRSYTDTEKINYIERKLECKFKGILPHVIFCNKNSYFDLRNIIDGLYTKCIWDADLDKIINKHMELLTHQDVDILYDLLNSPDKSSLELGLQMLVGYNVTQTPCTVRLLLYNPELEQVNSWHSVGVSQVKKSIDLKGTGWNLKYKETYAFDDEINDLDKELSYRLWSIMVKKYINNQLKDFNLPELSFKCYEE